MKKAAVATSCVISVICLTGTSLASPGVGPYSHLQAVSHSVKAPQAASRLVPGMRVIKEVMGYRLAPPIVLMPGMKIVQAEAVPHPNSNTLQVFYHLISNQPATKLYEEYQQFYGNFGIWRGYIGSPQYGRNYIFNLRLPPSRVGPAAFNIWEKMLPEDAKYIGSQRAYAKSFIGLSIWVPFAYSQKYQQQHHGVVQYPLPVDSVK